MKNEEVTAEWARKTAKTILGEKVKEELEVYLERIKLAVKQNKMSVDITTSMDDLTKLELEKRGFKVSEISGDFRDPSYITINW